MRCEHNFDLAAPFLEAVRGDIVSRYAMKRKIFDGEDGLQIATTSGSIEAINDDPARESKHKIFLSHSGVQKEFVEHLCKALEERCHYPFFDRRPESLPKGKKFSALILKAVEQCQLFVVVISEDYFMSKWPMIELNAFVKATKEMKSNKNLGMLPLFYGLSVSDLKDEKKRQRWFEKWETFAREDLRGLIKVEDWKYALDELTKFNGLLYGRELKQVVEYENEIVSHICKLVTPDIKWEDSHVQGNAHEVVMEKMKQVGASQLAGVKVVGLYGVGGIGKTTACKTLCNELSNDFEGRVCHIEFGSASFKELLQKVLIKLTRKSRDVIGELDEGQCKDVLYKNFMKQKTFLAIDNVWDNANSIKQALVFLKAPSHPNSFVLVTTRAPKTLEILGVDGGACLEMPDLGQGDATNLFVHYAANGQQFTSEEDLGFINLCVRRCYFSKGGGRGFHFHPLALEALGRQLSCRGKSPSEWVEILSSVLNSNEFSGPNEVFGVLRSSFDLLRSIEQALFMDVGIFLRHFDGLMIHEENLITWSERLCCQYKRGEQQMQNLLNDLKGKGLLQDADLSVGRISMHDLYREFVVLEAKGKLVEATSIGDQKWVYVDICDGDLSKLEATPAGRCWEKLTRLFIEYDDELIDDPFESLASDDDEPIVHPMEGLGGIEWHNFSNVLVLRLYGLSTIKGALNLEGMKCLQTLLVYDLLCIERLEGLEGLANLTLFEWRGSFDSFSKDKLIVGRFPRSLEYLVIYGVKLSFSGLDVFAQCRNLSKLTLISTEVGVQLDLSNCWSLKYLELSCIFELQTLLAPSSRMASKMQCLNVVGCWQLFDIRGLDQLVSLEHLEVKVEALMEVPNLLSFTKLQTLTIHGDADLTKLHFPRQLQEFHYGSRQSIKAPNLIGLNQLQVLDLSQNDNLTCVSEMGDLPALRSLNLSNCWCLHRLPDLSKSTNLEELDLGDCDTLELHEEDIQMLATLPSLRPVPFSSQFMWGRIKLDVGKRKVLRYMRTNHDLLPILNWMEGEWEEAELGQPPIKLGDYSF